MVYLYKRGHLYVKKVKIHIALAASQMYCFLLTFEFPNTIFLLQNLKKSFLRFANLPSSGELKGNANNSKQTGHKGQHLSKKLCTFTAKTATKSVLNGNFCVLCAAHALNVGEKFRLSASLKPI